MNKGDLVKLYLTISISNIYFGLYRDDTLGVVQNKSGPTTKKIQKNIQKIYKENKLNIISQCNSRKRTTNHDLECAIYYFRILKSRMC